MCVKALVITRGHPSPCRMGSPLTPILGVRGHARTRGWCRVSVGGVAASLKAAWARSVPQAQDKKYEVRASVLGSGQPLGVQDKRYGVRTSIMGSGEALYWRHCGRFKEVLSSFML